MTYPTVRAMVDDLYWKIKKLSALSVAAAALASTIQSPDRAVGNVITLAELAQEAAEEAEDSAGAMLEAIEET